MMRKRLAVYGSPTNRVLCRVTVYSWYIDAIHDVPFTLLTHRLIWNLHCIATCPRYLWNSTVLRVEGRRFFEQLAVPCSPAQGPEDDEQISFSWRWQDHSGPLWYFYDSPVDIEVFKKEKMFIWGIPGRMMRSMAKWTGCEGCWFEQMTRSRMI
jgi:hypothetical protein